MSFADVSRTAPDKPRHGQLRLSRSRPVRWLSVVWVEFFRGVPLLLLIFFTFFGLPKYGVDMTPFRALVLALTLYNGAILGEIFRAGILSLDRGQTDAAYALGLDYWQSMFSVIIPQAARRMMAFNRSEKFPWAGLGACGCCCCCCCCCRLPGWPAPPP